MNYGYITRQDFRDAMAEINNKIKSLIKDFSIELNNRDERISTLENFIEASLISKDSEITELEVKITQLEDKLEERTWGQQKWN